MKGFPDLPPLWLLLFLALNWAVARVLPGAVNWTLLSVLSWGFIAVGLVLIAWSAWWFWHHKTPIEPHHAPKSLIIEGPYRLSRNPIYLAMAIILGGSILGRGQVICLVLLPIFVVILNRRFIVAEEAGLRAAFGAQAETYLQKTRRWV